MSFIKPDNFREFSLYIERPAMVWPGKPTRRGWLECVRNGRGGARTYGFNPQISDIEAMIQCLEGEIEHTLRMQRMWASLGMPVPCIKGTDIPVQVYHDREQIQRLQAVITELRDIEQKPYED